MPALLTSRVRVVFLAACALLITLTPPTLVADEQAQPTTDVVRHLCHTPLPHLTRPDGWSEARFRAFCLTKSEFAHAASLSTRSAANLGALWIGMQLPVYLDPSSKNPPPQPPTADELLERMLASLSEDERERVTVLFRQMQGPRLLLSDEPTIRERLKLSETQQRDAAKLIGKWELLARELRTTLEADALAEALQQRPGRADVDRLPTVIRSAWLRFWLDEQLAAGLRNLLTEPQRTALSELYGEPIGQPQTLAGWLQKSPVRDVIQTQAPVDLTTPLYALDPPTPDDVKGAWLLREMRIGGDPNETSPERMRVVIEPVVDHTTSDLVQPLLPPGRLHAIVYRCTVYFARDDRAPDTLYIDRFRLHPVTDLVSEE